MEDHAPALQESPWILFMSSEEYSKYSLNDTDATIRRIDGRSMSGPSSAFQQYQMPFSSRDTLITTGTRLLSALEMWRSG